MTTRGLSPSLFFAFHPQLLREPLRVAVPEAPDLRQRTGLRPIRIARGRWALGTDAHHLAVMRVERLRVFLAREAVAEGDEQCAGADDEADQESGDDRIDARLVERDPDGDAEDPGGLFAFPTPVVDEVGDDDRDGDLRWRYTDRDGHAQIHAAQVK